VTATTTARPGRLATIARRSGIALLLGAALGLAACGSSEHDVTWDAAGVQASFQGVPFAAVVANSPNSLGVGLNRVEVILQDGTGALIADAEIVARFYRLADRPDEEPTVGEERDSQTLVMRTLDLNAGHETAPTGARLDGAAPSTHSIANAAPRPLAATNPAHEGDLTAAYTTMTTFDASGWWGIALDVTITGKTYSNLLIRRFVLEDTPMPGIGDAAIPSKQLTLADVDGDLAAVSSATVPQADLLDETIADALGTGKPVVIAFVTPAYCQTRFCGPVLELAVTPAWQTYGDRVEFLHIEPYNLEKLRTTGAFEPVPTVFEWGLETEPFIYVIGRDGTVVAAIEGITNLDELVTAIEAALR
jgi:hypothetical protein